MRAAWPSVVLCASMLLAARPADTVPLTSLEERMQLFRDGTLRGFALAELPDVGGEVYSEADFKDLAATGANVVRVSIQLHKCKGCQRYDMPEDGIRYVERVLARGERYGFRVVVTLLATPWGNQSDYWESENLKADIVANWGQVARRLKGFAALQAYDLINEPVVPEVLFARTPQPQWSALAGAIAAEIRAADPNTPLMVEPAPWGLPSSFKEAMPIGMAGVVYSFHLYAPHEFTHQGLPGYPRHSPTRATVGTSCACRRPWRKHVDLPRSTRRRCSSASSLAFAGHRPGVALDICRMQSLCLRPRGGAGPITAGVATRGGTRSCRATYRGTITCRSAGVPIVPARCS